VNAEKTMYMLKSHHENKIIVMTANTLHEIVATFTFQLYRKKLRNRHFSNEEIRNGYPLKAIPVTGLGGL
jgi:hypothetical protein